MGIIDSIKYKFNRKKDLYDMVERYNQLVDKDSAKVSSLLDEIYEYVMLTKDIEQVNYLLAEEYLFNKSIFLINLLESIDDKDRKDYCSKLNLENLKGELPPDSKYGDILNKRTMSTLTFQCLLENGVIDINKPMTRKDYIYVRDYSSNGGYGVQSVGVELEVDPLLHNSKEIREILLQNGVDPNKKYLVKKNAETTFSNVRDYENNLVPVSYNDILKSLSVSNQNENDGLIK